MIEVLAALVQNHQAQSSIKGYEQLRQNPYKFQVAAKEQEAMIRPRPQRYLWFLGALRSP